MAAALFFLPYQVATHPANFTILPGAVLKFYLTGTTTPVNVWTTSALNVSAGSTITANGGGRFDPFYLNTAVAYRLIIQDKDGTELEDIDPFIPGTVPAADALSPYSDAAAASAADAIASAAEAAASAVSADASADVALAAVAEVDVEVSDLPVPSRDILAITATSVPAYLSEPGREGVFVFDSSNLSAQVTADLRQAIYVAPSSDDSGASGAWVRRFQGALDVRWFGAVGDGSTDDTAAIQAALDRVGASGIVSVAAGKTYKVTSLTCSSDDIAIDARGATITSARTSASATLNLTGNRIEVIEGTWKLTGGSANPWHFEVTGTNCKLHDPRMVKTPDAGGYNAYFRHTADGVKTRGMRAEGSNGFFVEASNSSFSQTIIIGQASGGDDGFAIKALNDNCRNVTIDGLYAENLASAVSIGSEVGVAGAADANYTRTAGQINIDNVTAKNCYGLIYLKPGAVGAVDVRDGTVEDVFAKNLLLIDESGTKCERPIAIVAGRGARIRNISIEAKVRARTAGGSGRLIGADVYITGDTGGTVASSISNVKVIAEVTDIYSGVANDGSHPGYPFTYAAAVQVATFGTGVFSNINLDILSNGTAQSAVVVGPTSTADLDGQVNLTRLRLTNSNQSNAAAQGGLALHNSVVVTDPSPVITPAFGSAYNLADAGARTGPSLYRGALVKKSVDETAIDYTTARAVTWDAENYDTDAAHPLASTVTITIASPGVVTCTGHNFLAGSPIVFTTTGALPTGLTAGTTYFVVSPAANTFQVSATLGGSAINTSGSQSGTHTATNYSRLIVPPGITKVKLGAKIHSANLAADGWLSGHIRKNGSQNFDGSAGASAETGLTSTAVTFWTPVITVVAADYFEAFLQTETDTSIDIQSAISWFAMEIVQ